MVTGSAAPIPTIPLIRVLLVDDHTLMRAGLRALLDALPGVQVVAEASDGQEAARLAATLKPSIALLDIAMPVMTGLLALREIRLSSPATKVLLLSMYNDREYVTEAIHSGAAGYLIKDAAVTELALAIAAVERGDTYLSPSVSRKLAEAFVNRAAPAQAGALTARRAVVAGYQRNAGFFHQLLRFRLQAHGLDRRRRRADEDEARVGTGPREFFVLAEEAVARVDRLRPAGLGGLEYFFPAQIAVFGRAATEVHRLVAGAHVVGMGVGIGIHGDRAHRHAARGGGHAAGDFTAIGDQDFFKH